MEQAAFILIAIISILIILLLTALVVLAFTLVKIAKHLRTVSRRAEETSANVSDVVMMVSKRVAPVALSAAVAAALRRLKR